jgi:hypothetical protein
MANSRFQETMVKTRSRKQVNIRLEASFYRTLEAMARRERRSVPQMARLLIEEGMRTQAGVAERKEDAPGASIAVLAAAGASFDWLEAELDLYDDSSGEPV